MYEATRSCDAIGHMQMQLEMHFTKTSLTSTLTRDIAYGFGSSCNVHLYTCSRSANVLCPMAQYLSQYYQVTDKLEGRHEDTRL
jgi:hypothetical protein